MGWSVADTVVYDGKKVSMIDLFKLKIICIFYVYVVTKNKAGTYDKYDKEQYSPSDLVCIETIPHSDVNHFNNTLHH